MENTTDEEYKADLHKMIVEIKECMKTKITQLDIPQLVEKISVMAAKWNAVQVWPQDESNQFLQSVVDTSRSIEAFNSVVRNQHGFVEHIVPSVAEYVAPVVVEPVSEDWKEEIEEPAEELVEEPAEKPVVEVLVVEELVETPVIPSVVIASQEPVCMEEEAPQLLSEADALSSPLQAVAQELRVEASKWDNKNPIIEQVEKIGGCFERLSRFHNELKLRPTPEAKKGFITAARDIVSHTNELVKPAKTVSDGCTDIRLQRNLVGTLDRLSTLAQQLKIVAAVKAAAPKDTDQDAQLIMCAQNLQVSIKGSVKECDSISLKQKSVALSPLKFQRKSVSSAPSSPFAKKKISRAPSKASPSYRSSNQMLRDPKPQGAAV
jgi:hypothetical protein